MAMRAAMRAQPCLGKQRSAELADQSVSGKEPRNVAQSIGFGDDVRGRLALGARQPIHDESIRSTVSHLKRFRGRGAP